MSFRSIVVLLLAGVCGLCAAVALLNAGSFSSARSVAMGKVVIAAVEIHRGELITDKMVRLIDWPKSKMPAQSFSKLDDVVGRVAVMGILIPEGMRAFTILTPTDASLVAGFIVPDHHVDVVLTVSGSDDASGGGTATVLLQNIRVLAVGQHLDVPRENKMTPKEMKSVTLAVTPEQAAKLSLAQTRGTLHLSLRSETDVATAAVSNVTLRELRFQQGGANSNDLNTLAGSSSLVVGPTEPVDAKSATEPPSPAPPVDPAPAAAEPNRTTKRVVKSAPLQIRVLRGSGAGSIPLKTIREGSH
jgi:pilus assembly protein CpaB